MMVFVGETDSGLVLSWRKVTGPHFCQLLELLDKGHLETFYPQMGFIHFIQFQDYKKSLT